MIRGGILASAAAAAIAAGVFGLTADAHAQAKGKQAPLELKADASVRPWKRYTGWPARDESKWSTLAKVSSPPAPKAARKISRSDHRRCGERRQAGGRPQSRRLVSCLPCHGAGR